MSKKFLGAMYPEINQEKIKENSRFLKFFEELASNPNKFQFTK